MWRLLNDGIEASFIDVSVIMDKSKGSPRAQDNASTSTDDPVCLTVLE